MTEPHARTLDAEVRALRENVAALHGLLQQLGDSGDAPTALRDAETPTNLARQVARRDDEIDDLRQQLLRAQRSLETLQVRQSKMLQSRTWKWGRVVARIGTAPGAMARALYGWLLAVSPHRFSRALRRAVARARERVPGGVGGPQRRALGGRSGSSARSPLVPIPVHGPEGVGAPLTAPAVLLVAYGLDADELEVLVHTINDLRREVDAGIRALVVTDCDAFHVFRKRSLLFEYIPPRREWEKASFTQSYDTFRAARLAELISVYAPDRIVHVRSADDFRGLPVTLFTAA